MCEPALDGKLSAVVPGSWPATHCSSLSSFLSVSGQTVICYYSAQVFAHANRTYLIEDPFKFNRESPELAD